MTLLGTLLVLFLSALCSRVLTKHLASLGLVSMSLSVYGLSSRDPCRINPHKIIPSTYDTRQETQRRIDNGIKQFLAAKGVAHRSPGIDKAVYICSPRNAYQRWMRRANLRTVNDHHTKIFSQPVVEAYVLLCYSR